ncbi:MAG TPA: nitroreductase [Ferruginibacter sp.]|jgi:nitroreductase|nr:nitroreductase [Ferruginibacter sp.]
MSNTFSIIADVIKQRRSTKPAQMNGKLIPDAQVQQLLELADWAPTHGNTEPWRFFVYGGTAIKDFCTQHAELYKKNTDPEKYLQANYDKFLHNGDTASHIIMTVMHRGALPKVPVMEEEAAVSSAIQNILLGATALGIASFWSTGGMVHHYSMKELLHLRNEDVIMGMIYLGYSDVEHKGKRIVPIAEKVKWSK